MNKRLNANHAGLVLIFSILFMCLLPIIVDTILMICGVESGGAVYEWISSATSSIAILLAVIVIAKGKEDFGPREVFNLKKVTTQPSLLSRIAYVIGICITLLMFSSPILSYLTAGLVELGFDTGIVSYPDVRGGYFFVGVLVLAILPALSEELLTRGVLLTSLKKGGYIYGILMSGLLFAIMHGNPLQLIHQFLLGAIYGYIVVVSNSILPAILGHFFNNFMSVGIMALMPSEALNQPDPTLAQLLEPTTLIGNISTVLIAGMILVMLIIGYTNLMLSIKNDEIIKDTISRGGDVKQLNLVNSIKGVGIAKVCEYLDESPAKGEDSTSSSRMSKWLFVAIGMLLALWIVNTLVGFGVIVI